MNTIPRIPKIGEVWVCRNGLNFAPDFLGVADLTGLTATQLLYGASDGTVGQSAGLTFVSASNQLIAGSGLSAATVAIDGAAATLRTFAIRTAGLNRWVFEGDATAEAGANAGTVLNLKARADDGSAIDTVFSIVRASGGTFTLARPLLVQSTITTTGVVSFQADADAIHTIGFMRVGLATSGTAGEVYLQNGATNFTSTNYAIRLRSDGGLNLNVPTGGTMGLRINNVNVITLVAASFSTASGTAIVSGDTTDSTTTTTGGLQSRGGIATVKAAWIGTTLTVVSTSLLTGNVVIGSGSGSPQLSLSGVAGGTKLIDLQTAGVSRWAIRSDSTAETGSNAGSAFLLTARDDTGVSIDSPIGIIRASGGLMTISRPVTISGGITTIGQLAFNGSLSALDTGKTIPTMYNTNSSGGAYPFNQAGHLVISPRISGASRDILIYPNATASSAIFFSSGKFVFGTGTTDEGAHLIQLADSKTISGTLADGYAGSIVQAPTYSAATAQTVTRHNYHTLLNPVLSGAGPAALTDACVFRFDAAAGTHKAVDAATTKTTPGGVDAWVKVNVNGTVLYMPAYTSKTA